jgi:hypothetical protein
VNALAFTGRYGLDQVLRLKFRTSSQTANEGHLATLDQQMDNFLLQLQALPTLPSRAKGEGSAEAAKDYASNLQELEAAVRERLREVTAALEEATGSVEGIGTRLQEIEQAAAAKWAN